MDNIAVVSGNVNLMAETAGAAQCGANAL